jgi:hypothetical protein
MESLSEETKDPTSTIPRAVLLAVEVEHLLAQRPERYRRRRVLDD